MPIFFMISFVLLELCTYLKRNYLPPLAELRI